MWPTVEVRWFYPGQVPGPALAWFRQVASDPEEQPGRVDYYLLLESTEALGIKMREGRIEIKQRQQRLGLVRFQDGIAGQVEAWRKWSFGLAWAGAFAPPSSWIVVEKKRTLHRFQIGGEGQIVPLPAGSYEAVGCGLELTRIGVGGAILVEPGARVLWARGDLARQPDGRRRAPPCLGGGATAGSRGLLRLPPMVAARHGFRRSVLTWLERVGVFASPAFWERLYFCAIAPKLHFDRLSSALNQRWLVPGHRPCYRFFPT